MTARRKVSSLCSFAVALVCIHLPTVAQACTACMGDPNSKTAGAINAAIFLMLGFVALMLGSLAAFGWYLFRRQTGTGTTFPGNSSGADTNCFDAFS